ncbi:MAG: hypothetical protein Q9226_004698, partial [Calogaya cf. arnoldii]
MKALALPEYVPMARLASNIYLEGRSARNHTSPNLDIGKAHHAIFKRWVARHKSLEVGATEVDESGARDINAFLADPIVGIFSDLLNIPTEAGGSEDPGIEIK